MTDDGGRRERLALSLGDQVRYPLGGTTGTGVVAGIVRRSAIVFIGTDAKGQPSFMKFGVQRLVPTGNVYPDHFSIPAGRRLARTFDNRARSTPEDGA